MTDELEVIATIVVATFTLVIFVVFILIFSQIFYKRQKNFLAHQAALKTQFEQEILRSQIEVQNETLKNISQDLHDNIGQMLTVVKINLSLLEKIVPKETIYLSQATDLLGQSMQQIRDLTRSLDGDFIKCFGLENTLRNELRRIERMNILGVKLDIVGEKVELGPDKEVILFRMCQEALNNILKHACASSIIVNLSYSVADFKIVISDNGKGFIVDSALPSDGSGGGLGLTNFHRRAAFIGASIRIGSIIGIGTTIEIKLNI